MDFETCISRYVKLLIGCGLNVQKGQLVNIAGEVYHREFLYRLAEEAYSRGAAYVNIDLVEPRAQRLRVQSSTVEQMNFAPSYLGPKYGELVDTGGANLRILGPEDPDMLKGLDPQRVNTGRVANYQAIKYFYEEGIGKSKVHWLIAAAATKGWAKRLFADMPAEGAEARLWAEIFKICRVDGDDYEERFLSHNKQLKERARKLSAMGIERLRFSGPGTDLIVGLSSKSTFKAGSDLGPRGVEFEPNIPSEECFTSPYWRRTEGRVRTTRPFFINGTLIRGLSLVFEGGEVASFEAEEGADTFREYINSDPGGKRLGEVALVGIDSPIYKSGIVFEEILFDENAACHIAVGSAYKFCFEGAENISADEFNALGCNESSVHTDMMISSEDVDVAAILASGSSVTLIKQGEWTDF